MTDPNSKVIVYILCQDDRKTDEKVKLLAERYCGVQGDYTVARTDEGKPYFANVKDVFFSVSHSGDKFVCAFFSTEVGVDVQEHTLQKHGSIQKATEHYKMLAKRFFHPKEADYVNNGGFYQFFEVWCARESYVKYTGQGIDKEFSEHCVVPADPLDIDSNRWQAMGKYFVKALLDDGYTLCVCTDVEAEINIEYVNV